MSGKAKADKYHTCGKTSIYDILIVGGGLAGLHCALRLSKEQPTARIVIAEAYSYIGGRVYTYKPKGFHGIQWEMGAGRIHGSHKRVLSYCKDFGLTLIPLSETQVFIPKESNVPREDPWPSNASAIQTLLHNLPEKTLSEHTIEELLKKTTKNTKPLSTFAYSAETHVLRADAALRSFQNEMGSTENFFVVKEGLSKLITSIVSLLKERGVTFLLNHKLVDFKGDISIFQNGCTLQAKHTILAFHSVALKQLPFTRSIKALSHVAMCPLLRIYAIFPTSKGQSWFSDLPKVVTNSPLRFIIPINPKRGVIMISYTDASDSEVWSDLLEKKGLDALQEEIMKEVRELFPKKHIPDPLYLKPHPWTEGCSYWKPGFYSIKDMSESVMNPLLNLYICGESFSEHFQCWMEGAIEHADKLLDRFPMTPY